MARCEELADDLDAGRASPQVLLFYVEQLRTRFDANDLRELLATPPREVSARVTVTITDELRDVLDRMRAHLLDEPR
jgi:hypothetical protein